MKTIPTPTGKMIVKDDWKLFRSKDVNFNFNMKNGRTMTWGETVDDYPDYCDFPHILDIEVTTICPGPANRGCSFCYKSNTRNGHNMSFNEFKNIIDKMPWLQQVALGADAQCEANPDIFKMMEYARSRGIIPNITVADVSEETAKKLAAVCGAVAVSFYPHAGLDVGYNSVKRLTDAGLTQVNAHFMISAKSIKSVGQIVSDIKTDERLAGMNALVCLGLKQKGRGTKHETASLESYQDMVQMFLDNDVKFGFDSCSAGAFLQSVKDHPKFNEFVQMSEPCESTRFSSYISEKGIFFPCSFTEEWHVGGWSEGINVLEADDFVRDVWMHPKTVAFREMMVKNTDGLGCQHCPAYTLFGIEGYEQAMINDKYQKLDVIDIVAA